MGDRYAVAGAQPSEIVALHRAGKTFADAHADHVDVLAREKMRRSNLRADLDHGVIRDAELCEARLRFDFSLGEMTPLRLGDVLCLGSADAKLQRRVAICRL